ncbi:MAG: DNA primase [Methylobacterium sp.]|nr:DNA primase [Methylobacterium sp.]MCA3657665.1 DNA primase [Methylobacterium sp.]MCA3662768.1 DNA primase [Methylobacterium sp.]MCA3666159.1 DNA primase [Methylobacterium sp.]MCA3668274.1 DNA primase [Methylobacterium sp.]
MRYPPSILEEIRARLPISAVVGRRVKLAKAGREWRGLSPFNAEKTPSFYVNDQKQFYHCFSSGKHGDIFSFVIETEGLSFPEAVERLAGEAGVTLPKLTEETVEREKKRAGLGEALEMAASFFEAQLKSAKGREARAYLSGRDLGSDVIARFRLGYAPGERYALRDHLAEKGVSSDVMIEAGLLVSGEDIAVPYDRFRDRVIFPIQDAKGRVIAFGGRALAKDVQAKYLNSPETPVFHKGATLYNLNRARKAAHDAGTIFVVEGYVDCIALDRAGLANVVAPLGTALTEEQLGLIWRIAPEPILCFDGDKAGLRAAHRALDCAVPMIAAGKTLRFAFLPEGLDPDDLLRSRGAEALREALAKPRPLVDVLFEREIGRAPVETPEQRADLEKRLFGTVARIADEDLKRHYRDAMSDRLRALFRPQRERTPYREGQRGARGPGNRRGGLVFGSGFGAEMPLVASEGLRRNALFRPASALQPREAALVLAAVHHPELIETEAEAIAELVLASPEARTIRGALLDLAASGEGGDFAGCLMARGFAEPLRALELAAKTEGWTQPGTVFSRVLTAWREASHLHERQSFLHSEIEAVAREVAEDGGEERFERLKALVRRRAAQLDPEKGLGD